MGYDPSFGQPLVIAIGATVLGAGQTIALHVRYGDGRLYSGYLDHDQLHVPPGVTDLSTCITRSGPWERYFVNAGQLTIPVDNAPVAGGTLAEGLYVLRVRPPDSNGPYSNQIGFVIDRAARPVTEQTSNNSGGYLVPQPVPGAYTVFRDTDAAGQFNGYSKIEFEAAQDDGAIVQRFTKTLSTAYWAPSANPADPTIATLRWVVGPSSTSPRNFKALVGFLSRFDRSATAASSLPATRHTEDNAGTLGRLGPPPAQANSFNGPSPLFYTLAPVELFPEQLSDTFVPIIDRQVRYHAAEQVFDTWHVEVRASQFGGLYQVRYVEWALGIADLSGNETWRATPSGSAKDWGLFFRWSVLEDWDWNADGTLNQVTQRGNGRAHFSIGPDDLPPDCWRTPGGCEKSMRHMLTPLRSYVPDRRAQLLRTVAHTFPGWGIERIVNYVAEQFTGLAFAPLHIGFANAAGNDATALAIAPDAPWTLLVRTADDTPYDGFLQVRGNTGNPEVWADQRGYPIYVHDGQVELLPGALALAAGSQIVLEARQQLLNANIAADRVLPSRAQPNNDALPFSNRIVLTVAD